jgi:hypothetical protein
VASPGARGRLTIDFDAESSLALVGVEQLVRSDFDFLFG